MVHEYRVPERGGSPAGGRVTEERGEPSVTTTPGVGTVHATQEQLNAMAQRCVDTGDQLAKGMSSLIERIQALSGTGMSGAANSALQSVSADLNEGLRTILNALSELASKISDASKQYGTHDEEAASDIRNAGLTGSVADALRG